MAKEAKKIDIVSSTQSLDLFDLLDGKTLEEAKEAIANSVTKLANGEYVKLRIEYSGYDGGVSLMADTYRKENDKEFRARLEKEEKKKEKARLLKEKKEAAARKVLLNSVEKEKAEYERLKAKFG